MKKIIIVLISLTILLLTGCSEIMGEGEVVCITTGGFTEDSALPTQYEVRKGDCGFQGIDVNETINETVEEKRPGSEPETEPLEVVSNVDIILPTAPNMSVEDNVTD